MVLNRCINQPWVFWKTPWTPKFTEILAASVPPATKLIQSKASSTDTSKCHQVEKPSYHQYHPSSKLSSTLNTPSLNLTTYFPDFCTVQITLTLQMQQLYRQNRLRQPLCILQLQQLTYAMTATVTSTVTVAMRLAMHLHLLLKLMSRWHTISWSLSFVLLLFFYFFWSFDYYFLDLMKCADVHETLYLFF